MYLMTNFFIFFSPGNIFSFSRAYIFVLLRELICSSLRPVLYDITSLKEEIYTSLKRGVMYQLKIGHRGCYIIKRYESPLSREKKTPILREKKASRSTPLQDVFKTSSRRFCLPGSFCVPKKLNLNRGEKEDDFSLDLTKL